MGNEVFDLDEGQQEPCRHCLDGTHGEVKRYAKGEAFLAGPGHTPYNGEPNFICREHLDRDAVICGSTQLDRKV